MLAHEMPNVAPTLPQAELIERFVGLRKEVDRTNFLHQNPELQQQCVALYLADYVAKAARRSVDLALQSAEAACWLAEILNDDFCRAKSARAMGNSLSLKGKYREALKNYEKALDIFRRLEHEVEASITLSSSIQPLIYLSEYEEAFRRAENARQVFKRHGDPLRLARLDVNLANALHRQDRFEDALVLYGRALEALKALGQYTDIAIVLSNMAVCRTGLQDFAGAFDAYQQARVHCEQHQMHQMAAQADYNIAYLHYLRGEYARAIELYQHTRVICERAGDPYHSALCDLDQSEIYLDLSLYREAHLLAQQALASFEELKMGYETAKALTFLAIVAHQQGKPTQSLELFARARELFLTEKNALWPAVLDLYRAMVFYHSGQVKEALGSVEAAQSVLSHSGLAGKAALSELLRASLLLQVGDARGASYWCNSAFQRVERSGVTGLRYLAQFVLGQAREARGDAQEARACYCKAVAALENLQVSRHAEELRIPLLRDTWPVYEALIDTALLQANEARLRAAVFEVVEKANSQQLADLFFFTTHRLPTQVAGPNQPVDRIGDLRRELNWDYRQMSLRELGKEKSSPEHLERLRQRIQENEASLLRALKDQTVTGPGLSPLRNGQAVPFESIRLVLPADATLVSYFELRGGLSACVLNAGRLEIFPLCPIAHVRGLLRALHNNFLEVWNSGGSSCGADSQTAQAAKVVLMELYSALFAPLRQQLRGRRLVIVPQGFLHYIPFHALFDGSRFLVDDFTISYSTSASLYYHLCSAKDVKLAVRSVVLHVSGKQARQADEEAQIIAGVLPDSRLLLGDEATEDSMRKYGPGSLYLHLETQAFYRHDNPLFSTLGLHGSWLHFFDLFHLDLPCSLVTLGGCGPALNQIGNGQELAALMLGLHTAGAQAVLTSMWNPPEPGPFDLLTNFYRKAQVSRDKAEALRLAVLEYRDRYPHPYYWAPFTIWGRSASKRHH
jgi:tetratricopeptide (TPR) repeat protein